MADTNFPRLAAVLEEYAAAFRNLYQDKLILEDRIATGELLNSVSYRVQENGTVFEVTLSLAEYWKYIENGRPQGSRMPPPSAILEWIRAKPVLPRPSDKGKVPRPEHLAWAIAKGIKKRTDVGPIPGDETMAKTAQELNAKYRPIIAQAFAEDTMALLKLSAISGPESFRR